MLAAWAGTREGMVVWETDLGPEEPAAAVAAEPRGPVTPVTPSATEPPAPETFCAGAS